MTDPYKNCHAIAVAGVDLLESRGWRFRIGVVDSAAKEAAKYWLDGAPAVASAIERTFEGMRISLNPRWDGSIA